MFGSFHFKTDFNGFTQSGFGGGLMNKSWNGLRCNFWLSAGAGIDSPVDGGRVSNWVDMISGTKWGNTVLASRPFYRASDLAFNGHPVIENGFLRSLDNQSLFKTGDRNFMAFVVQATLTPGNRNTLFTLGTVGGEISLGGTTTRTMGVYNGATPVFATTTLNSLNPLIFLISKNRILLNGLFETITGSQASLLLSVVAFNRIFGNDGGVGFSGKLAEVLNFPFDPTDDEMLFVSSQLNSKYLIY